jgi:xanthine dehydrogenase D subunit
MTVTRTRPEVTRGIGTSPRRADGVPKVEGSFSYVSDLQHEDMLWGATLRSPHPSAEIKSLDVSRATALAGVAAVLTQAEVPGRPTFGLEHPDQPVLCDGTARYWGEPIAIAAAADLATARRAIEAIEVELKELEPLSDPEQADLAGSVYRRLRIRTGDQDRRGQVVVEGYYEVGMQDQAPLGPEAGLAIPDGMGGVDLYATSQFLHVDHEQIVACLGLQPDQVRCHPPGMGGAFGAREDVNLHIHLCWLALETGRPVKMVYPRSESFFGHVHRHPARMWYRHEADADGTLARVEARILLDGGAYASTTAAVLANACYFAAGPYRVESVVVDGAGARTNNPPAGAMRGFGAVQVCFAYEAQMDKLASSLGIDPLDLRRHNALATGDRMPTTGQLIETPLPTREVIDSVAAIPLPDPLSNDDPRHLPGGTGLTTRLGDVRRGVGYAVGIKNLGFSEGFDDYSEARVRLEGGRATVETAAVEVGQGLDTVLAQIARTALGIDQVVVEHVDTGQIGSAGSTSASRQTQLSGGATLEAATKLRDRLLAAYSGNRLGELGVMAGDEVAADWEAVDAAGPWEELARFRHPATEPADGDGHGVVHADLAVAAHRAVVDVDPELGLMRVVRIDTAQDVGRVLNPDSVRGQIEGGIMQGFGLAVMEELVVDRGVIRNPNFTDYLLPTFLDAPEVEAVMIEREGSWGPFGAKGVGESPTISSGAAVAAAVRAATDREVNRVPIRPGDIAR